MSAKLVGAKQVLKNIDKAGKRYLGALSAAVYQKGFQVMAEAKKRTPVEFGVLRNSGYVAPPTQGLSGPTVEVGFGTSYAVPVHERTEVRHRVGEAKFLANAIKKFRPGWIKDIKKRTAENFARGVAPGKVARDEPAFPNPKGDF